MLERFLANIQQWNRLRRKRRHGRLTIARAKPFKLAVLAIMKNESMNIDEWINHYISMGVEKIFLIDNGSTDDSAAKAKFWASKGIVELVEYPKRHRQRQHYWSAFKAFDIGRKAEWLLVADLDEFWFCPTGEPLSECLADFDGLDVIYANCRNFGSNGLDKHPSSIRFSLTLRATDLASHSSRKYICRTSAIKSKSSLRIHAVTGVCSSRTVSDNACFHLNHYPIQSFEFFQKVKMKRGDAVNLLADSVRDLEYFKSVDAACIKSDRLLADMIASGKIN